MILAIEVDVALEETQESERFPQDPLREGDGPVDRRFSQRTSHWPPAGLLRMEGPQLLRISSQARYI